MSPFGVCMRYDKNIKYSSYISDGQLILTYPIEYTCDSIGSFEVKLQKSLDRPIKMQLVVDLNFQVPDFHKIDSTTYRTDDLNEHLLLNMTYNSSVRLIITIPWNKEPLTDFLGEIHVTYDQYVFTRDKGPYPRQNDQGRFNLDVMMEQLSSGNHF